MVITLKLFILDFFTPRTLHPGQVSPPAPLNHLCHWLTLFQTVRFMNYVVPFHFLGLLWEKD